MRILFNAPTVLFLKTFQENLGTRSTKVPAECRRIIVESRSPSITWLRSERDEGKHRGIQLSHSDGGFDRRTNTRIVFSSIVTEELCGATRIPECCLRAHRQSISFSTAENVEARRRCSLIESDVVVNGYAVHLAKLQMTTWYKHKKGGQYWRW